MFCLLYYLGWTKPQIAKEFGCNEQRVNVLMKAASTAELLQVKKVIDALPQVMSEISDSGDA
jgi:DNA-directed RNA polymerase specialized sigma24 family protein